MSSDNAEEGNAVMEDGNVMKHLRNDNEISWVCQFCGHPFPWQVRSQTFGHHLATICESAPEDVKEAAQRAEGGDSNFNTQTENSSNAGREVEAAECSRSVNREPMRMLDASETNVSNFEAETDSNIVQRSNKRQRSTQDALAMVAALEELQGLSITELQKLEKSLDSGLSRVREKKVEKMRNEIGELQKKDMQLAEENERLRIVSNFGDLEHLLWHISTD